MVAADSESYTMGICFFRVVGGDDFKVGCFLAFGNSGDGNEEHSISASGHVRAMSLA